MTASGYDDGALDVLVPPPVATGVDIDVAAPRDLDRGDDWRLDPRVDAGEQARADLHAGNDLDRGHLVRHGDPVWGAPAAPERAESDTSVHPNAAPQAGQFNHWTRPRSSTTSTWRPRAAGRGAGRRGVLLGSLADVQLSAR